MKLVFFYVFKLVLNPDESINIPTRDHQRIQNLGVDDVIII